MEFPNVGWTWFCTELSIPRCPSFTSDVYYQVLCFLFRRFFSWSSRMVSLMLGFRRLDAGMFCTVLCVPLWCCRSVSCGTWTLVCTLPLLPAFSVIPSAFCHLIEGSPELDGWRMEVFPPTPPPLPQGVQHFSFLFDKVVYRERPFIFLKAYLSLWDGQAHPGGSFPCGLGCSHLSSCRQLCAAGSVSGAGTSGTSARVAGIGGGWPGL